MDISRINDLLGEVRYRLESLDPMSEENGLELQVKDLSDNDSGRIYVAQSRLQDLLNKLTANRSDSNRIRAYGSK